MIKNKYYCKWYDKNRIYKVEKQKEYYYNNREERLAYQLQYYRNNRKDRQKYQREYNNGFDPLEFNVHKLNNEI